MDKISLVAIIISLISASTSLVAAYVAYNTFKRNKTFENENQLFKYKLERYNELLKLMVENHAFFRKIITEFYYNYTHSMADKVYDLKSEELDAASMRMEMQLLLNAVFLPVPVVNKIQGYIDQVFSTDMLYCTEEEEYLKAIEKLEDTYELMLDAAEVMRYDLGIDDLDKKLVLRTIGRKNKPERD